MSAPVPGDPCSEPIGWPAVAGGKVRVVEILATGTSGGAQEHLYSLMSRLDPTRYEASVIALSGGSAVRKLQRAGFAVSVLDDARRRDRDRAPWRPSWPTSIPT